MESIYGKDESKVSMRKTDGDGGEHFAMYMREKGRAGDVREKE